jgi:hypothetical protein
LLAHGRWFSPDTPVSSTTKTGRHDIVEILLKVGLKHQQSKNHYYQNPDRPDKINQQTPNPNKQSNIRITTVYWLDKCCTQNKYGLAQVKSPY